MLFVVAAGGALLLSDDNRVYGFVALGVLALKLGAASLYRPRRVPPVPDLSVAVVIPVYNEDENAFVRCLSSALDQTHPPDEIWVIDDGSPDPVCLNRAREILGGDGRARIHALTENQGKRHALAVAFAGSSCDLFLTVDSDTVLLPAAAEELLRAFSDPNVKAATGTVRALNPNDNLLTRLIDLRYANAFLFERAAYSRVGAVLCCCGSLAMYRADIVRRNLDDFVTQSFLGVPVQYGDDRRLTNYCLLEGDVVFVERATAFTAVPQNIGHWLRQQSRWNKSFFRETLWVLRGFPIRSWPWRLSASELFLWVVLSMAFVVALVLRPATVGAISIAAYLGQAGFMAYARSVRFLGATSAAPSSQFVNYLLAPLYSILHVVFLVPLRFWSLATLRRGSWGTRDKIEVVLRDRDVPGPLSLGVVPAGTGGRLAVVPAMDHTGDDHAAMLVAARVALERTTSSLEQLFGAMERTSGLFARAKVGSDDVDRPAASRVAA